MNYIFIILILLISSCGTEQNLVVRSGYEKLPNKNIHEDFISLIQEFIDDANSYNVKTNARYLRIVKYGELPLPAVGECNIYTRTDGNLAYLEIVVHHSFKDNINTMRFKGLVYHELGHCLLFKEHEDGQHIMRPSLLSEKEYEDNWDYLVQELFDEL